MVRPIEITDALSKSQEVGRMQQNAQTRPDIAHDLQKAIEDKLHIQQTHAPNPVPETDHVVLHIDEQEREKHKEAEDEWRGYKRKPGRRGGKEAEHDEGQADSHIDVKA
ncbi:hypothetical protein ACFL55_02160 [Candidatus Latescibacterota bacterium]